MHGTTLWKRYLKRGLKSQRHSQRRPSCRLAVEQLESRCLLSVTSFRPISEIGNNVDNPNLGIAGTNLIRISPADYRPVDSGGDGLNTPSMHYGAPDFVAGPRLVSNVVSNQATELFGPEDIDTVSGNSLSDFSYTFGQFVDHDLDLTPDQGGQPQPPPPNLNRDGGNGFPIPADPNQPADLIGSLAFSRSKFDPATGNPGLDGLTGTDDDVPREQINVSTSYLDLSQVYGSTDSVAASLRTSGGRLKSSPGADGVIGTKDDLLPYNNLTYFTQAQLDELGMANDAHLVPSTELFAAGDKRANETTELTSLQTLFLRNHNRLARQLRQLHPFLSDETVYQEARKVNIAQYQFIIYTQYLPNLLGPGAIPAYTGYDPSVDPSISTEFSTVGFRFGHSMLNNDVHRDNNDGTGVMNGTTPDGPVNLEHTFFNPNLLKPGGVVDSLTGHISTDIGAVLKGDADHVAQANDVLAVSSIRNLLFGQGGPGEDLIARDLWRADDHGIGSYNEVRVAYGLPPLTDTADVIEGEQGDFVSHGFEQVTSDPHVQELLFRAFADPAIRPTFLVNGKFAGDINPFIAGLAEDHVPGSEMGPLFQRILVDQFTRLRDGDRFYFLNERWTPVEILLGIQGATLGQIIKLNTNVTNLQFDVFKFSASIGGVVRLLPHGPGVAGITVQLTDLSGNVLATTVTDSLGRYNFDAQSGLVSTGAYEVVLSLPPELVQVRPSTEQITTISNGGTVKRVNFGVRFVSGLESPFSASGGELI